MSRPFLISTEGYLDKQIVDLIIENLAFISGGVISKTNFIVTRANGNSGVINQILNHDDFCIGIIDNDKVKPKNLNKFNKECPKGEEYNFDIKANESVNHFKYLVTIKPAADGWIDKCADLDKIERTDFGLPNDFKEFTHITKRNIPNDKISAYIKKLIKSKSKPLHALELAIYRLYRFHFK